MLRAGDCGSAALLARFQAEAEAVARLHHPNIVQIYDYGEQDGLPYLALELVEGGSLSAVLSGTVRKPREAAEIVVTLARAVQFAHEQGIVHRDLKPANVLVSLPAADSSPGRTTIKITDFGLAKVFREGEESHTQTGTIVGTPSYMAPEQARGRSQLVGPATDVYALGAILYELLDGPAALQGGHGHRDIAPGIDDRGGFPHSPCARGCRGTWRRSSSNVCRKTNRGDTALQPNWPMIWSVSFRIAPFEPGP